MKVKLSIGVRPRSFMRLDAARHNSWMEVDRLSK